MVIRGRALALLAAISVAGACSSAHPSGTPASSTTAPTTTPTTTAAGRRALGARYLAIATIGNDGLDKAFDALDDEDRNNLEEARADLRSATATEHQFDRSLLQIDFPPALEATARELYRVNEARADLTATAATSGSLPLLHQREQQLTTANAVVVKEVKILRTQLGLPPAPTS